MHWLVESPLTGWKELKETIGEQAVMEPWGPKKNGSHVKWVSIVGARPQFVKLAPMIRAFQAHNALNILPHIDHYIIQIGLQSDHEANKLLFLQMGIPEPTHNLSAGSGSDGQQLARMLGRLEPILASKRPDWVVVYGDTNATVAGALLAARLKLPIAHVEAGCRSDDASMPEEQNRIVADHLSHLLLAPSQSAIENLHREGIGLKTDPLHRCATLVGDVMYDSLLHHLDVVDGYAEESLPQYQLESKQYYLLTLHRAENTDSSERLHAILDAISALDLPVLFPIHPRTQNILDNARFLTKGMLQPVSPVGYFEMLALEKHARKIFTDSGGVQKEAFYLGTPCITLRDRTEWPETVELGANRIAGNGPDGIRAALWGNHQTDWRTTAPYGNGQAAEKIVSLLLRGNSHRKFATA